VNAAANAAATQALPVDKAKPESAASLASAGGEPQRAAHKSARKVEEKKRTHVAARVHRARRPRATAVADGGAQTGAASQFATAPSQQFQTAPQPADGSSQTNGERRVKLSSRKPARKRSAVGGPYVRPPQH
jgi:hypothetical protein